MCAAMNEMLISHHIVTSESFPLNFIRNQAGNWMFFIIYNQRFYLSITRVGI